MSEESTEAPNGAGERVRGAISVTIPGEPIAQGRPRAFVRGGHARVYQPKKSRSWKGAARYAMKAELGDQGEATLPFPSGPLAVVVRAYHTCPKSDHRVRNPAPLRWRAKKPDAENVAKAVLDAATGVLWGDDAQVARLTIEQYTAAQGDAPRVELTVSWLQEVVA